MDIWIKIRSLFDKQAASEAVQSVDDLGKKTKAAGDEAAKTQGNTDKAFSAINASAQVAEGGVAGVGMAAVVQDVQCNIGEGTTTVRTGTCGRLEADNLMALYRAARGRRFSILRLGRGSGDSTDGNAIDANGLTPNDSADGGTPPVLRERFAVEAVDSASRLHRVDINPAAITFATSGDAAAQTIHIREMVVPYMDNGTLKAKRAQVLCGAGYASEIPLGGLPSGSAANQVLGTNASNVATWLSTVLIG